MHARRAFLNLRPMTPNPRRRSCVRSKGSHLSRSGLTPGLVGTWELTGGASRWVWEIHENGTYRFLTGGPRGVPHRGWLAAYYGDYRLHSTPGTWVDEGSYEFKDSATLMTYSVLGTGTWHRVLCGKQGKPCVSEQVDHRLVGTWVLRDDASLWMLGHGAPGWVWEIHQNGTYRQTGPGGAPRLRGSMQAFYGSYRLNPKPAEGAVGEPADGADDGLYRFKDSATFITCAEQSTDMWHRVEPKVTGDGKTETQPVIVRK